MAGISTSDLPEELPNSKAAVSADVAESSFSDQGPWVINRSQLTWTAGIVLLRENTRRLVPQLTAKRRLPPPGRSTCWTAFLHPRFFFSFFADFFWNNCNLDKRKTE